MIRQEIYDDLMVKVDSNYFLEISFPHKITVTKLLAKTVLIKIKELSKPNYNLLFDLRAISEISPAAKSIIASVSTYCPPRKIAIIVGSASSRNAGTYFIKSEIIKAPLRLYGSKEDSIDWLIE